MALDWDRNGHPAEQQVKVLSGRMTIPRRAGRIINFDSGSESGSKMYRMVSHSENKIIYKRLLHT